LISILISKIIDYLILEPIKRFDNIMKKGMVKFGFILILTYGFVYDSLLS